MSESTQPPGQDAYSLIRAVLEARGEVLDTNRGTRTACPVHNGTHVDNFSLYPSGAGRCWSRCNKTFTPQEMARVFGLEIPTANGVTVEDFLAEFGLPEFIIDEFGLRNERYQGRACVIVPHLDEHGDLLREQRRLSLNGGQRFNWKGSGGTSFMFGLHQLPQIRQADFCLIVEGASDVLCAAAAAVPALGMPGAGGWREEYRSYFSGLSRVGVWREPGEAGRKFVEAISLDIPTVKVLTHPVAKDPAELFKLVGRGDFKDALEDLWNRAPLASDLLSAAVEEELEQLRAEVGDLLEDHSLAECIEEAITTGGFVGDLRPAMVVYMTITGRLLNRPPNLKLLGQPGSGKNAAIDAALPLFPESSYLEIDAASGAYLIYSGEVLKHRAVILTEMDSMARGDTNFASFLRTLIDKGKATYRVTVEGQQGETRQGKSVFVEGPIAFITTGIRDLESQAHSRMLTQPIDEDPNRVKKVAKMQAKRRSGDIEQFNASKYQALQRYFELNSPVTIVVPFWDTVVDEMPRAMFNAVRQTRDADQLLAYIESFALLYQFQRKRDVRNRVVASIDDYRRAAALLEPLFQLASADGVTDSDREAYAAIERLQVASPGGITGAMLADELGRARSTISSRVTRMQRKGLLKDLSQKKHEHLWIAAAPLPESSGLPSAERVQQALAEGSVGNPTNIRTLSAKWPAPTDVFEASPPYPPAAPPSDDDDDVVSF
jgi:hypothetical protein